MNNDCSIYVNIIYEYLIFVRARFLSEFADKQTVRSFESIKYTCFNACRSLLHLVYFTLQTSEKHEKLPRLAEE